MNNSNVGAERAVLAGICRYGNEAFYDVSDLVSESTFTIDSNQIIFKCIKRLMELDGDSKIDIASIYAVSNTINLSYVFDKPTEAKYLQALFSFPIEHKSIRKFASQIKKLEIIRNLDSQLTIAKQNLSELTGEESLTKILSVAEDAVFDFPAGLTDDKGPRLLGGGMRQYLEYLENNKVDKIGIATGYDEYDSLIGGGLRSGVNIVAARNKVGKSYLSANIATFVSSNDIPVLYLDTEMHHEDQMPRVLGLASGVPTKDIETGKFGFDTVKRNKLYSMADKIGKQPLWYMNISGTSFEEQSAIMRRWLCKNVGLKPDGTANKCIIIYDYIKLMDDSALKNLQEYQAIGFLMTNLHNFTAKYRVPMLGLCQTNKDGLTQENSAVFAQSDRIGWLCVSGAIYKPKSDEEIAQDGPEAGNRKLVVVLSRYGGGSEQNDYINFRFDKDCGKIQEVGLHSKMLNSCVSRTNDTGFTVENDGEIPFE